jgi:hypothetical protein
MPKLLLNLPIVPILICLGCAGSREVTQRHLALSEPFSKPSTMSVFNKYEPLNVEIFAPLKTLFTKKNLERAVFKKSSVKGMIIIEGHEYPVSIHIKGFSTASICNFPKLEISILNKSSIGTIFSESKSIDLNTHCGELNSGITGYYLASHFAHREAVIYRILDILGIPAYRARPVLARYHDQDSGSDINPEKAYQAFFVEDFSSFKKRLGLREIAGVNENLRPSFGESFDGDSIFRSLSEAKRVDLEGAARVALFQRMIANQDWFIQARPSHSQYPFSPRSLWNIKVVEDKSGKWIVFPQDFSLSGIVIGNIFDSNYETVFQSVSVEVRNRIKNQFLEKKSEIMSLGKNLDSQGQKQFEFVIGQFFKDLSDNKIQ